MRNALSLNPLEITLPLPIRYGAAEALNLAAEEMRVMLNHIGAKCVLSKFAVFEVVDRLLQGIRHTRQMPRRVDIALENIRRLNLVRDPV